MFEGVVLPGDPVDGAIGALGVSAETPTPAPPVSVEGTADLLASLGAGGVLAGVVEGLLAQLLVTAQSSDGSNGGEGLFVGEPGGDAALVAAAEGHRTVDVEEAGASGLMGLGASGVGELAAACHRLAAWATWGEALAAACLTGCSELSTHPGQWGPGGEVSPVIGFEERRFNATCLLSARLGVSRARAGQIVDHGQALMGTGFGPVESMERCGVLDAAKASLVTRRLEGVPTLVALAVQEKVLPQAPRRSVSQVGRDIERALMEIDPDGHAERTQTNIAKRCVSRPRPAGEGVCRVGLLLPIMDALLLDATLDAIAASARAAGEERALSQLRADAVTAMTLSTLRTSQQAAYQLSQNGGDSGGAGGSSCLVGSVSRVDEQAGERGGDGLRSFSAVETDSLVSQDPWASSALWETAGSWDAVNAHSSGSDPRAGDPTDRAGLAEGGGVGMVGSAPGVCEAPAPGRLLPDGVPLEGLLSTLSGLVGSAGPWWTPSATGPLPLPTGIHVDVNVTVPMTSLPGPAGPAGLAPPTQDPTGRGPGGGDPGGGECPGDPCGHDSGGTAPGGRSTATPELFNATSSAAEAVAVPAHQIGGPVQSPAAPAQATEVAEVTVGARSVAVPAITAWALAAGGTWRRLITDPASGVVLDIGRTRYRPPAGLADLVRARDKTCVFPTCQTPASRCDIDHLTPWSEGGTTSLDNLAVLCQAHHRLKHTPGWALTRNQASGVLSWHTPDKTVYQRHPGGTINRLPRKVGPHQHLVPASRVPADLSEQIGPELIDRLNTALDNAHDSSLNARPLDPAAATTNDGGGSTRLLMTRGPRPGQRAGDFETTPYPNATHILGLVPLIDEASPF